MPEFAHLHLHTEFSLLDGMGRMDEYIELAHEHDIRHIAVTDHGVMYASLEWHKKATKAGLHPIIGMEAYLSHGKATERDRSMYHLLLLAQNNQGYRNLLRLASFASLEGYYYKPRIDLEMLAKHSEGVIVTSACLGGPLAKNYMNGQPEIARRFATQLKEIFGRERFFVELQDHGIAEQLTTNREMVELAKALDLDLIASNDVHYARQADAPYQDLLVCIQTNTTLADTKRLKQETDQHFFKSPAEMAAVFPELPQALANTIRIAEMCELDLGFTGYHMPVFTVPDGFTQDGYLEHLCRKGAEQLYGHVTGAVAERLEYELSTIKSMGFVSYFLIVWDFIRFAKERGVVVGPGRGSAVGSIVSYSLGITALDPLKYDLIFERFLNPARISMPDIDIDFADHGRAEVIQYVVDKYGDDRVAQIVTFGTLAAKASVRDVGKAMGIPGFEIDQISKLIPIGPNITIDVAMARVPELRALYDANKQVRDVIDSAKKVEGIARHSSTHAAGVVISRDPLVEHVPLQRAGGKSEGDVTTQYAQGLLEEIGLLKMDFLGLSTLSILGRAVELARAKDPSLTLESIPLDDELAYERLRAGETVGIFQLEGGMTTRMTVDVGPTRFEDLIALMALIRPGPMELAPEYIARKHGRMETEYIHPSLEAILAETYGVALYQEQIIRIANSLAGFSMSEGDGLRKAMGKKLPAEMAKYRDRFIEGCRTNEIDKRTATSIYAMVERFAGYGFNKAHSAAYAVIAAQTAYLKANYPVEFMAAVLTTDIGNTDKVVASVAECRRSRIPLLPPDINESAWEFGVGEDEDGREAVRYGLGAIRNLGEAAVRSILATRTAQPGGRFASLDAMCQAVDWTCVNKRVLESLAKSGALDTFGGRSWVLGDLERATAAGQSHHRALARGQIGLFGALETSTAETSWAGTYPDLPSKKLLAMEKEFLGLYLSDHPLTDILAAADLTGTTEIAQLANRAPGDTVRIIAVVRSVRRITTRKDRTMAVAEIEDLGGSIELVVFPDVYDAIAEHLEPDAALFIVAKVDRRSEQLQLVCESASVEISARRVPVELTEITLNLPTSKDVWRDIELMQAIDALFADHDGGDRLVIELPTGNGMVRLRSRKHGVEWSEELAVAVDELLGRDRVRAVTLLAS